ncbi:MAG: lipocalin family protein [Prolixibacteraceae bacterium]|jgi:apolipoprotein D and lipocalin family protein|nr:lipocalin family protein [Prolixibacteraceae bacterium]
MKRLISRLLPVLFILVTLSCKTHEMAQPDQSIDSAFKFELEEYLGAWYEIARFDHKFERGLEQVTATYSMRTDGKIKVLNQGYKDGKLKKAEGKAKLAAPDTPRRLKVSFFLFFYAPYNILELDEDYTYALIGSETEDYLWILSRTPQMDDETYQMLLENAKKRGYDTSKLIEVKQPLQ